MQILYDRLVFRSLKAYLLIFIKKYILKLFKNRKKAIFKPYKSIILNWVKKTKVKRMQIPIKENLMLI